MPASTDIEAKLNTKYNPKTETQEKDTAAVEDTNEPTVIKEDISIN
jgi:hypothetical protein